MIYLITGFFVWLLVLKKGVYPDTISARFKWLHAGILFSVMVDAWSELKVFSWLIRHISEISACLSEQQNTIGKPLVGLAKIVAATTGVPLIFVCCDMARRQRRILKWYFILWPISFLAACYTAISQMKDQISTVAIWIGSVIGIGMFIMSIAFYLPEKNKNIIFSDQK